ncbi:hypothetical protein BDY19DRAFT_937595 [Irpex rosettiformis]|uniref:Uncharacterized protein n=1 Tax=Irpex rosettiformis TaxID=378272 RepID=A0ACB8UA15_9APHY|nr:hypothetical protein BDY19DRAFT_937595 [Irpex rosettiformis]
MALLFPAPWRPKDEVDVLYARESTAIISRTCAYHIVLLHTASLWDLWLVSWLLSAVIIGLWIINAFGISRMKSSWFLDTIPHVLSPTLLCLATLLLTLFVSGLVRLRSKGHLAPICRLARYAKTSVWYMMWKEKLHLILMIWVAQTVASAAVWARLNPVTWSIIELVCFTVIIICGGRMYQHCIRRGNRCPTLSFPCLISSAVRAGIYRRHRSDFGADTLITDTSHTSHAHIVEQPQTQPPVLRVVTQDLRRQREAIEMTTLKSDDDSASPTSASQKMMVAHAIIHSEPSSSTVISPSDTIVFPPRTSKTSGASGWLGFTFGSKDTQLEEGRDVG